MVKRGGRGEGKHDGGAWRGGGVAALRGNTQRQRAWRRGGTAAAGATTRWWRQRRAWQRRARQAWRLRLRQAHWRAGGSGGERCGSGGKRNSGTTATTADGVSTAATADGGRRTAAARRRQQTAKADGDGRHDVWAMAVDEAAAARWRCGGTTAWQRRQ